MKTMQSREWIPGVYQIQDSMGVMMTLIAGHKQALLIDTGYGLEDVRAASQKLTDRPVQVLLTHGHHDHALGARWFSMVWLAANESSVFQKYTSEPWRRRVMRQAEQKGLQVPEDFLTAPMAEPRFLRDTSIDLGGFHAEIVMCPGHTPGSCVIRIPEADLLITGDDWNPCTWLWFPEALPVQQYRKNLEQVFALPFRHVLCSHAAGLFSREDMRQFLDGITDVQIQSAGMTDEGNEMGIRTATIFLEHGYRLVFDADKAKGGK